MTREEYADCILIISEQMCSEEQMNALLDLKVYISELETRITEFQTPLTCDGCKNEPYGNTPCLDCIRYYTDKYEPKEI
jgi:hypothetical protein